MDAWKLSKLIFFGQVSTIMRVLTSKDEDLLSHFDIIDKTQDGNNNNLVEQMPINNHTDADRGKIEGQLPLEHIIGFAKLLKKLLKTLFLI